MSARRLRFSVHFSRQRVCGPRRQDVPCRFLAAVSRNALTRSTRGGVPGRPARAASATPSVISHDGSTRFVAEAGCVLRRVLTVFGPVSSPDAHQRLPVALGSHKVPAGSTGRHHSSRHGSGYRGTAVLRALAWTRRFPPSGDSDYKSRMNREVHVADLWEPGV